MHLLLRTCQCMHCGIIKGVSFTSDLNGEGIVSPTEQVLFIARGHNTGIRAKELVMGTGETPPPPFPFHHISILPRTVTLYILKAVNEYFMSTYKVCEVFRGS